MTLLSQFESLLQMLTQRFQITQLVLSKKCIFDIVDLFEKLVPIPVYEALSAFENRKTQIVNTEIGRLREQTQLMNRWEILVECLWTGENVL